MLNSDAAAAAVPVVGPSLFSAYAGRAPRRRINEDITGNTAAQWRAPVLVSAGVLMIAFAVWLLRPHAPIPVTGPATKALQSHVVTPGGSAPVTAPAAAVPAVTVPAAAAPTVALAPPAPKQASSTAARGDIVWRVVAFTFNRKEDARRRAGALQAKHPNLNPEVLSSPGTSGPYLVVLGGRMTRRNAMRLQSKARSAGLPRDSYILNFSH